MGRVLVAFLFILAVVLTVLTGLSGQGVVPFVDRSGVPGHSVDVRP